MNKLHSKIGIVTVNPGISSLFMAIGEMVQKGSDVIIVIPPNASQDEIRRLLFESMDKAPVVLVPNHDEIEETHALEDFVRTLKFVKPAEPPPALLETLRGFSQRKSLPPKKLYPKTSAIPRRPPTRPRHR